VRKTQTARIDQEEHAKHWREETMNESRQFSKLPERIGGLGKLAHNLWWSWHSHARGLFRSIDLKAWRESGHNPIRMLASLPEEVLYRIIEDGDFLSHYDAVMGEFEPETESRGTS
jgi:starch phosphorylase